MTSHDKPAHSASDFDAHWAAPALRSLDQDAREINEDNDAIALPSPGETRAGLLARSLGGLDLRGADPAALADAIYRHDWTMPTLARAADAVCNAWPAFPAATLVRLTRRAFLCARCAP